MDRWNLSAADRKDFTEALQTRSFQVLDSASAVLNGTAPEYPDLVQQIDDARAEVRGLSGPPAINREGDLDGR